MTATAQRSRPEHGAPPVADGYAVLLTAVGVGSTLNPANVPGNWLGTTTHAALPLCDTLDRALRWAICLGRHLDCDSLTVVAVSGHTETVPLTRDVLPVPNRAAAQLRTLDEGITVDPWDGWSDRDRRDLNEAPF